MDKLGATRTGKAPKTWTKTGTTERSVNWQLLLVSIKRPLKAPHTKKAKIKGNNVAKIKKQKTTDHKMNSCTSLQH